VVFFNQILLVCGSPKVIIRKTKTEDQNLRRRVPRPPLGEAVAAFGGALTMDGEETSRRTPPSKPFNGRGGVLAYTRPPRGGDWLPSLVDWLPPFLN